MEILIYPNQALRSKATSIATSARAIYDSDIEKAYLLMDQMITAMQKNNGLGLAATQVGECLRMFVFNSEMLNKTICMINPDIIWCDGKSLEEEACLSIPGFAAKVERAAVIGVKYYDIHQGMEISRLFGGRDARVIQHEIDHLDGILYIDHLSSLKRQMFKRKYAKLQKLNKINKY